VSSVSNFYLELSLFSLTRSIIDRILMHFLF